MAIFGSKKDTEKKAPAKKAPAKKEAAPKAVASEKKASVEDVKDVLVRPRITEKAANLSSENVYTFDIRQSATKRQVTDAVKKLYKVTPRKVTVVNTPAKRVRMRSKRGYGKTTASRKAYVFLKKGDQIQFS